MKRPYSELMEKANCVQYALAEKIYQLGRADAMNEFIDELPYSAMVRMSTLKRRAEEVKEQKNDSSNMDNSNS